MSEHWEYAEKMLDNVSRTFALNIRILGKKLRRPILLAYLYMRIADTIEDDADLCAEEKTILLSKFSKALNLEREAIDEFQNALPENWKNSERDDITLSCNAHIIIPLLSEFPEFIRNVIKKATTEMCEGMAYFAKLQETKKDSWFYIESESDLNRYCYYVAGLVGNMITELFYANKRFFNNEKLEKLRSFAASFGLALQLVNIMKDIQCDSLRKVCFVPMEFCRRYGVNSVQDLFSSETSQENKNAIIGLLLAKAMQHLRDAKEYIKTLPRINHRRRLFCLLPSLMAADNLSIIGNGSIIFEQGRCAKISRKSVNNIIYSSILLGWSNKWVEYKFTKLTQCRI